MALFVKVGNWNDKIFWKNK